ncbi:MAG: LysM peptidoglycan-binding domain-containing protein, partial [Pseudomonadota bacterium]
CRAKCAIRGRHNRAKLEMGTPGMLKFFGRTAIALPTALAFAGTVVLLSEDVTRDSGERAHVRLAAHTSGETGPAPDRGAGSTRTTPLHIRHLEIAAPHVADLGGAGPAFAHFAILGPRGGVHAVAESGSDGTWATSVRLGRIRNGAPAGLHVWRLHPLNAIARQHGVAPPIRVVVPAQLDGPIGHTYAAWRGDEVNGPVDERATHARGTVRLAALSGAAVDRTADAHVRADGWLHFAQSRDDTARGSERNGQDDGIIAPALEWLNRARRQYNDEVVPRLSGGGGFDAKPVSGQAIPVQESEDDRARTAQADRDTETTPGGGLSFQSAQDLATEARNWINRALRGYQGQIVPRLSGGVPETAVTDRERADEVRRNQQAREGGTRDRAQQDRNTARERREAAAREAERRRRAEAAAAQRREAERARQAAAEAEARRRADRLAQQQARERAEAARRQAERDAEEARRRAAQERRDAERRTTQIPPITPQTPSTGETDQADADAAARERIRQREEAERRARERARARDRERRAEAERRRREAEQRAQAAADAERRQRQAARAAEAEAEAARRRAAAARQEERQRAAREAEERRRAERDAQERRTAQAETEADARARREAAERADAARERRARQETYRALLARARQINEDINGLGGEISAKRERRQAAFETVRQARRAQQERVADARRALTSARDEGERVARQEAADTAEQRLEDLRQEMTRSRQSALAYGRITGRVNAEQRRARSALTVAEGAFERLEDNPSERVEQQDSQRLRRAVRRMESALERAKAAVDSVPDDDGAATAVRRVPSRDIARRDQSSSKRDAGRNDRRARSGISRQRIAQDESDEERRVAARDGRRVSGRERQRRSSSSRAATRSSRRTARRQPRARSRPRPRRARARSRSASRRRTRLASLQRRRHARRLRRAARRARHRRRASRTQCRRAGRRVHLPGRYVVRRGDNLWRIARRHYGRGKRFRKIYRANLRRIRNPNLIYPCQKFRLPRKR